MGVWTAPITFTAGQSVTAAQMNVNVRDNTTFLKGALDLLTQSTTADTGTATYLAIVRTSTTDGSFVTHISGDTVSRFALLADGTMQWGAGGSTARDTNLFRATIEVLKSDDALWAVKGVRTFVKAGVPVDGDFPTGFVGDGILVVDTTNNRIYAREDGVWRYAALT